MLAKLVSHLRLHQGHQFCLQPCEPTAFNYLQGVSISYARLHWTRRFQTSHRLIDQIFYIYIYICIDLVSASRVQLSSWYLRRSLRNS